MEALLIVLIAAVVVSVLVGVAAYTYQERRLLGVRFPKTLTTRAGLLVGVVITTYWIVVGIRISAPVLAILLLVAISMFGTFVALLWGWWFRERLLRGRDR
jgi:hypothetical protein